MSSRKPGSIWVTQLLLILWVALFDLFQFLGALAELSRGQWAGVLIRVLMGLAVSVPMVWLVWALQRRKRHSRVAAGVLLFLFWLLLIYVNIVPQGPVPKVLEYSNDDQRVGGMIGTVLMHLGIAVLLYRVWFGKRVRLLLDAGPRESTHLPG
jgi:hypothetical protein